jgi:hypothetical protein
MSKKNLVQHRENGKHKQYSSWADNPQTFFWLKN